MEKVAAVTAVTFMRTASFLKGCRDILVLLTNNVSGLCVQGGYINNETKKPANFQGVHYKKHHCPLWFKICFPATQPEKPPGFSTLTLAEISGIVKQEVNKNMDSFSKTL